MDLGKLPLITMMTARMAWLGQRQQVLAQNIANAGTPGYTPLDVKPLDFHGLVRSDARRFSLAHHRRAPPYRPRRAPTFRVEAQRTTDGTTRPGSAVVVENPPLALALWEGVEIDQEVPETYYKAVAGVIGYVWRLKRKAPPPRRS